MAKILQGIFGTVQGKIGNVVGSSWKGVPVLKSKAASVANPQTAAQVEQRSRMTAAVAFAQLILANWIKPIFDRFAIKSSGFNLFIQENVAKFAGGGIENPAHLVMSVGNMSATSIDSAVADVSEGTVVVTWVPDTSGFHLASDLAYIMAYHHSSGLSIFSNSVARSIGTATLTLPAGIHAGDTFYVWLVFKRANGLYVSLASVAETFAIA